MHSCCLAGQCPSDSSDQEELKRLIAGVPASAVIMRARARVGSASRLNVRAHTRYGEGGLVREGGGGERRLGTAMRESV